jgi:hypothetical protein
VVSRAEEFGVEDHDYLRANINANLILSCPVRTPRKEKTFYIPRMAKRATAPATARPNDEPATFPAPLVKTGGLVVVVRREVGPTGGGAVVVVMTAVVVGVMVVT